jgi:hypothetical protein
MDKHRSNRISLLSRFARPSADINQHVTYGHQHGGSDASLRILIAISEQIIRMLTSKVKFLQFVGLDDDYVQMMAVVFDCFFPEEKTILVLYTHLHGFAPAVTVLKQTVLFI